MMNFLLLQKSARVPLKNRFRLAIIIPGKCKYILLNKNVRICNYLQRPGTYFFQELSDSFHVVPRGFRWLSLVILGYSWLYLVIYDSNICEIVCAFAIIFPVICRNFLQSRPDKMTKVTRDNLGKPAERLNGKGAIDSPNIYDLNRRIYTHYTHCFIH